jgi:glycosyltransferase involved in cell wall biosynthesis
MRELSAEHEIYLCSFCQTSPELKTINHLRSFCERVHVQIERKGFSRKVNDVLRSLFGSKPHIVNANTSSKLKKTLPSLIESWEIELLQLEELCVAANVNISNTAIPTVLHTYNAEGPLFHQVSSLKANAVVKRFRELQAKQILQFEKETARSVDALICVSSDDRDYFRTLNSNTFVAVNGVPSIGAKSGIERNSNELLFVGTLCYPPNDESMKHFVSKVFPLIRKQNPMASLKIIGRQASSSLRALCGNGITIHSDVDDIKPHLDSAGCMVVPLNAGGGSRLKILEAFASGLPVVSSSIGASGLDIVDNHHLRIADSPEAFASAVNQTLNETDTNNQLVENAKKLIAMKHLWKDIAHDASQAYSILGPNQTARTTIRKKTLPKLLFVIPHSTLLGPQGHRERLDGVISLLRQFEITYLVPRTTPPEHLPDINRQCLHFFDEPKFLSVEVPFFLGIDRNFQSKLDQITLETDIDVVFFDFPWGLSGFRQRHAIPSVYHSQGVEKEFASIALKDRGLDFTPFKQLFSFVIGFIEKRACKKADLILAMSKRDSDLLSQTTNVSTEKMLPLAQPTAVTIDTKSTRGAFALPKEGKLLVFHGSARHLPNRTAIDLIRNQIAPRVAELDPSAHIVIAGPGIEKLKDGNILQVGFVEDLHGLLSCCDIAIVPILEGSGVRMKMLDYFRAGLPVITTKKGIEGLSVSSGKEAILTNDNINDFISTLGEILGDEKVQGEIARNASIYLNETHSSPKLEKHLVEALTRLVPKASIRNSSGAR